MCRIAEYPGAVGVHAEELVVKNVEDVLFERIVENLTKPRSLRPRRGSNPTRVSRRRRDRLEGTSKTSTSTSAADWTDELPIVPPTIDASKRS